MVNELTKEQKKILQIFSMYIQSYGVKSAFKELDVMSGYEIDYWGDDWFSEESSLTIPGYDAINNFFDEFTTYLRDELLEPFTDEENGSISVIINAKEKEITFKAYIRRMNVEYESIEEDFEDGNEDVQAYLNELSKSHKFGEVTYEGGGDSGYVNGTITLDGKKSEDLPSSVEDYIYGILSNFGGWEINEGSQGKVEFDFLEKKVVVNHGMNYEETFAENLPLRFEF